MREYLIHTHILTIKWIFAFSTFILFFVILILLFIYSNSTLVALMSVRDCSESLSILSVSGLCAFIKVTVPAIIASPFLFLPLCPCYSSTFASQTLPNPNPNVPQGNDSVVQQQLVNKRTLYSLSPLFECGEEKVENILLTYLYKKKESGIKITKVNSIYTFLCFIIL